MYEAGARNVQRVLGKLPENLKDFKQSAMEIGSDIKGGLVDPVAKAINSAKESGSSLSADYRKSLYPNEGPTDVDINGQVVPGSRTPGGYPVIPNPPKPTPEQAAEAEKSEINPWVVGGGLAAAIPIAFAGGYGALALRRKLAAQKRK